MFPSFALRARVASFVSARCFSLCCFIALLTDLVVVVIYYYSFPAVRLFAPFSVLLYCFILVAGSYFYYSFPAVATYARVKALFIPLFYLFLPYLVIFLYFFSLYNSLFIRLL